MATKVTKGAAGGGDNGGDEGGDAPLLDLNEASVKKLIARARKRGYITVDELNNALPQDQMSTDQIEDVMAALNEMGVNIVENDEASEEGEENAEADVDSPADGSDEDDGSGNVAEKKRETVDRTDDPVRMYLREMGAVELLSREGEIAIAKRIEAGRDTMIRGLCESALTFEAIMVWREELEGGRILLREVIDLEQTYGGLNAAAAGELEAAAAAAPPEVEDAPEVNEDGEVIAKAESDDDDDFDDGAGPTPRTT